MIILLYEITQVIELGIGVYLCKKVYPEWRFETWWWKVLCFIPFFMLGIANIYNAKLALISNLWVLFLGIAVAIFYCITFKANFFTVLLLQIAYNINSSLLKMPTLILRGLIEGKNLGQINRGDKTVIEFICCAVINVLLIIFLAHGEKIIESIKHLFQEKKWRMGLVVIVQWCLFAYNLCLGEQEFQTVDLVVNISLIICTALAIQCFLVYVTYQQYRAENAVIDTAQNMMQLHYQELREIYNYSNQKTHDIKHHMLYLVNCLQEEKYGQAKEHIKEYLDDININQNTVWTGFPFLDFMINYKKSEMEEKGIAFTLELELYEYPFEDAELGVLLGNLLDNAIEAAAECEDGKKNIYLCLRTVNQMFMLNLKNSSKTMPDVDHGKFITRKKHRYAHGLGIENVKRIVEKYKGNISFQYNNEKFEVKILV